jgi:hypothetical protein
MNIYCAVNIKYYNVKFAQIEYLLCSDFSAAQSIDNASALAISRKRGPNRSPRKANKTSGLHLEFGRLTVKMDGEKRAPKIPSNLPSKTPA